MATAANYFPEGALSSIKPADDFMADWFSKHLREMDEPPLWPPCDDRRPTFRYLSLPSFGKPCAVRVQRDDHGEWDLVATLLDCGESGQEAGRVIRRVQRKLGSFERWRLEARSRRLEFWDIPAYDEKRVGLDGFKVVLEGADAGRYHIVNRWCPPRGPFWSFCRYLSGLKGFDPR
jgi:hypothetical protein